MLACPLKPPLHPRASAKAPLVKLGKTQVASKGSGNHSAQHRAKKSNFHSHLDYQLARPWLGMCVHTHARTYTCTRALNPSPSSFPVWSWSGLDKRGRKQGPLSGLLTVGGEVHCQCPKHLGGCTNDVINDSHPNKRAEAQGVGSGSCSVIKRKKKTTRPLPQGF